HQRAAFVAIQTQRYQEMMGSVYAREDHLVESAKPILAVRLVNENGGVTLFEGRFALTADPLTITPVLEPIA
ncbi:MAG: hypothetical protein ACRD4A_14050, partial [Candidatus Acidiferrales bacterium]